MTASTEIPPIIFEACSRIHSYLQLIWTKDFEFLTSNFLTTTKAMQLSVASTISQPTLVVLSRHATLWANP
jgi:hypothetical protein